MNTRLLVVVVALGTGLFVSLAFPSAQSTPSIDPGASVQGSATPTAPIATDFTVTTAHDVDVVQCGAGTGGIRVFLLCQSSDRSTTLKLSAGTKSAEGQRLAEWSITQPELTATYCDLPPGTTLKAKISAGSGTFAVKLLGLAKL